MFKKCLILYFQNLWKDQFRFQIENEEEKKFSFGFLKCFQQTKSYLDGTDGTGTGDWSFLFWGSQKIALSKKLSCGCKSNLSQI